VQKLDTYAREEPIAHVNGRKENARAWLVESVISPIALRRTLIMYDGEYAWYSSDAIRVAHGTSP
jgi:hypothetical protein